MPTIRVMLVITWILVVLAVTRSARSVPLDLSGDPGAYYDIVGDGKSHPLVSGTCDLSGASVVRIGQQVRFRAVVAQPLTSVMALGFSLDTNQDHATTSDWYVGFEGMVTYWNTRIWSPSTGNHYFSIPLTFYDNGLEVLLPLNMIGGDDGLMDYRVNSTIYIPAYKSWTGILDYLPNSGFVTSYVPEPAGVLSILLGGILLAGRTRNIKRSWESEQEQD